MLDQLEYHSVKQKISQLIHLETEDFPDEDIIGAMRLLGLGKMESIKMAHELFALKIAEAKDLVHRSLTWSNEYYTDEQLHDEIERVLKDI